MNILFHASFANKDEFLKSLKKKFIHHKIFTLKQNIPLDNIEVALVWNLPDKILKKLHLKEAFYGWNKNAGYGTKNHLDAITSIGISKFHRKTYQPISKLITKLST